MDIVQIKELAKVLEDSLLTEIIVKTGESEITLKREKTVVLQSDTQGVPSVSPNHTANENSKNEAADDTELYLSPMVGVFYPCASQEAEHYVKVGDIVKPGQPLCIIEAMKMMNEINSEHDMQIVEILAGSEEKVEYDQPLFRIKKI